MSKQVYEEALADVKKLKEVAEANALKDVIAAVTPRVREFIERQLLDEPGSDDSELVDDVIVPSADVSGAVIVPPVAAQPISAPDASGKVTLDLDALCPNSTEVETDADPNRRPSFPNSTVGGNAGAPAEYEVSLESANALKAIRQASRVGKKPTLGHSVKELAESATMLSKASAKLRATSAWQSQVSLLISRVDDTYDHVQESISDPTSKERLEESLEATFQVLNGLQEQQMLNKSKKSLNEEDVTLKLTGLPDDVDLDSVGVDLITGEDDGEGSDDLDMSASGDDMGGDDEVGDLDLDAGGDDVGADEDPLKGESMRLSDDTLVEIDENMLRRELARLKRVNEESIPSTKGQRPEKSVLDDFGGADSEGEVLDQDLPDLSPAKAARPLGEADGEDMDESDMVQIGDKRTRDDFGASATSVPSSDKDNPAVRAENLRRRQAFEKRLQERARLKAGALRVEAAKARRRRDADRLSAIKLEYANVVRRFNESVNRTKRLTKMIAEAKVSAERNGFAGSASATTNALRAKLAETNLSNAKLKYTNKLLQNDSLTARQKVTVVEQLESAKTVAEARLVYESMIKTLSSSQGKITESACSRVVGSGSRATRPASTTQSLNEGYEVERWGRLAGITK